MGSPEAAPRGPEEGSEFCLQVEFCLQGLLARARKLSEDGLSIETDPALMGALDQAVVDSDDVGGIYTLACRGVSCDSRYVVGNRIEPQKL